MRTLEIDNETKSIIFDGVKLTSTWTEEAAGCLMEYYGIDISHEIVLALLAEIDRECDLTEEERQYCFEQLKEKFDGSV